MPNRELVLRILDTKGGEVLKQSETSGVGTFSFVPQESGDYQFCLQDSSRGGTRGQQQRVVSLDIQALPKEDSIDFSELAKRENLKVYTYTLFVYDILAFGSEIEKN